MNLKAFERAPGRRAGLLLSFWPYAQPDRWKIGLALLVLFLDTLASLAAPWPMKLIFDNVLLGKHLHSPWSLLIPASVAENHLLLLGVLCAALLWLALLSAGATYIGMRLLAITGQRVVFRLRCALFVHLQQLSPSFYDRQRLGDLLTRLTSDVLAIQDMLVVALPMLLLSGMTIVGMIAVLMIINPIFGALGLVIALSLYLVLKKYLGNIKQVARQARRQEGDANAVAQENLLGIRVVQAFGMEAHAQRHYQESIAETLRLGEVAADLESSMPSVVSLVTDVGMMLVLGVGAMLVMQALITVGDLLVLTSYLRTMYKPMRQLSKLSNTFTRASASAERITDLLQTIPAIVDAPTAQSAGQLRGAIAFQHVSFGYDPLHPVLHDVSFKVRPGMMVALVGHTGAGKSSILHLIQRFYDPQQGQIRIDGRDLRDYTLASVRQQIALVPQDPMLFRASVRENIAYGRPEATDAEIVAAARAANADGFIRRLPQGYDTILEERGVGLSGGERQRLAIARAMVRQAPLLLLDEPTVGLDARSEQSVVEALERLMVGRTTLVSAHRLSTIQRADLILVIEDGRIVEAGTPAQLLAARGSYYQLYALQSHSLDSNLALALN
jgi:ATP-binding cassette, subfamily B, bacterial